MRQLIAPVERQLSKQGIEMQLQVNIIGYFLMMTELHPLLARTTKSRIFNVASSLAGGLDLKDLNWT
jgi:NAD(P)-dependent dehydrogenase (short-subunit alcohol dehydrogenase family)